jgi:hypothetical protein
VEVRRWAERVTVELVTQHPWLADTVAAHGEWHEVVAPRVWPISSLAAFAREAGKPKEQG